MRDKTTADRRFAAHGPAAGSGGEEMPVLFWTVLLFIHMLFAVTLLGAVTHQAVSVCWPNRHGAKSFVSGFRGVNAARYTNAIIVLFLCTAVLGSIIYPNYRINVRTVLHQFHHYIPEGSFEVKEHAVAIGAALLPAYWYFWRGADADANRAARNGVTILLAVIVWWAFMVGHVINNIRGFGA